MNRRESRASTTKHGCLSPSSPQTALDLTPAWPLSDPSTLVSYSSNSIREPRSTALLTSMMSRGFRSLCLSLALFLSSLQVPALDWKPIPGGKAAPLQPGTRPPGFSLLTPDSTGVSFTNIVPESRHLTNQILLNGAGLAAGDVDGDGWTDLYFTSTHGKNSLYRNLGRWRFEEITPLSSPALACPNLTSTGCAFADLDGDHDLDLVVNTLGNGTFVFYNDSRGRFTPAPFLLNTNRGAMSLALGDLDGDGFLDLYIANYRQSGLLDIPHARATFKRSGGKTVMDTFNGRSVQEPDLRDRFTVGPGGTIDENGEPDAVYLSQRGTNFVLAPFTRGRFLDAQGKPLTHPPLDWGLSVMIRDVNGDRLPDLYVCNDFQTEDRFWINRGGGRFQLAPAHSLRHASRFSMGVDFADINRDGLDDFLVLDMASRSHAQRLREIPEAILMPVAVGDLETRPQYGFNTLFLNRGDGTYTDIAAFAGLDATEWSWTCLFLDVDLDGWEDVLVSNGMERAARDADVAEQIKRLRAGRTLSAHEIFQARKAFPRLATPNLAFRNQHGLRFQDRSQAWNFNLAAVSQGMALADLDNDGDADVVFNNFNEAAALYRNEGGGERIAIRLRGRAPNTKGIGARITVRSPPLPEQSQEMIAGGRYLSGDDSVRTFACGDSRQGISIKIAWRGGSETFITNAAPNHLYEIEETRAEAEASPQTASPPPLFEDLSQMLQHVHVENTFDDWSRQPLLPQRLSQLGPAAAWGDINQDGWDDLVLGSGKSGTPAVFLNSAGRLQRSETPWTRSPVSRDLAGLLMTQREDKPAAILSALSNFEDGTALGPGLREISSPGFTPLDVVSAQTSAFGPLAMGSLFSNSPPVLFVGGRARPGQYPAPASSLLLKFQEGRWQIDSNLTAQFTQAGLVSAALWTDLSGDGWPELVLAGEWGPIQVFQSHQGHLQPWNPPVQWRESSEHEASRAGLKTLSDLAGHWISVASGDFDGDGKLDLVAGNWGLNSLYASRQKHGIQIRFADVDSDGTVECFESYWNPEADRFAPWASLTSLSRLLPSLPSRFPSHASFARASTEEALGEHASHFATRSSTVFESIVLLNRGDYFAASPLPSAAQFAPIFGIAVMDFNNDGFEDLALAQNLFGLPADRPRLDGGRGLLALGDGTGGFATLNSRQSGLAADGEQRAAAAADFDRDGRTDLVITQNGAATKLYRNRGAPPGLRVTLRGDQTNPSALGALVQVRSSNGRTQSREIQAGSGYWSQHGAVQVFAPPSENSAVVVRWPGGLLTTNALASSTSSIEITHPQRRATSTPQ